MLYTLMSAPELRAASDAASSALKEYASRGLSLDLSRGKPGSEQLAVSMNMLGVISHGDDCVSEGGFDCRNYGLLDGLPEAKRLFSDLLGIPAESVIVAGNSSLNLMYDTVARAMLYGVAGSPRPWAKEEKISFLCPVPGYDRHFMICQSLGIDMIAVPMTEAGPDMDAIEAAVADPRVKGVWCVPKFSNPQGVTYSDETVRRFAALAPAAPDFRIFWDNAYAVHDFAGDVPLLDIMAEAEKTGRADSIFYFASTSKITFPGSGVAIMACSPANMRQIKSIMTAQTIGFDKINQMRHVKFFKNADGIREHMKLHAALLRPKFAIVADTLEQRLGGLGIADWTRPTGGYFVSLDTLDGCAELVYGLAESVGVKLTPAGATFPYGVDPRDRNLRIAPTFPSNADLRLAMEVLCECIKLASANVLLREIERGSAPDPA